MKKTSKEGFTLIELMAVITIIGILAAIAIPQFSLYRERSKDSAARVLLAEIGSLEREYMAEHGVYIACPLNPPQQSEEWQLDDRWERLGFSPMQRLYGYQFKVDTNPNAFEATAIKDGKEIFFTTNATYDITKERPGSEKD